MHRIFVLLVLTLTSIAGYAQNQSLLVTIDTSALYKNDTLLLTGTTNLPTGTKISIALHSKDNGARFGKDTAVKNGQFSFSVEGPPFGVYTVDIMAHSRKQPADVLKLIGENGENLHGPLVYQAWAESAVQYLDLVQVGTMNEVMEEEHRHNNKISQYQQTLASLIEGGVGMEQSRVRDDASCIMALRKSHAAIAAFVATLDNDNAVETHQRFAMKDAAMSLRECTSCVEHDSAILACGKARDQLIYSGMQPHKIKVGSGFRD